MRARRGGGLCDGSVVGGAAVTDRAAPLEGRCDAQEAGEDASAADQEAERPASHGRRRSAVAVLFTVCSDEITADALQGTWQVVDQVSAALQAGKTYFGPQTPVTATLGGQDICAGGGITRSQVLPPTVAGYQALLAPFHTSSLKFLEAHLPQK